MIAILDLASGSLTLFAKECFKMLHYDAVMNVINEKKGEFSFYSDNMNKNFNESHFHYRRLLNVSIKSFDNQ